MRLAVTIAAWSFDPDATLPPDATHPRRLPMALQALGFSTVHLPLADAVVLEPRLGELLVGLEATDTLLVHVAGVLHGAGSVDVANRDALSLNVIADALAKTSCARVLVVVESAFRKGSDALGATDHAEAVVDALSCHAGAHSVLVAVHPFEVEGARLVFTHAWLKAALERSERGRGVLAFDAYEQARDRQAKDDVSGFVFLRGDSAFPLVPGRSVTKPGLDSEAAFAAAAEARRIDRVPAFTPPPPPLRDPLAVSGTVPLRTTPPQAGPAIVPVPPPSEWLEADEVVPSEPLETRLAAALAASDYRLVVKLSRERLALLSTAEARVDELFEIGRLLVAKLHDLPEAVQALEEARQIDPAREDILEALRRAYSRLERWTEALEVTLALIKVTKDPRERAGVRVAAAALACRHLSDDDYAIELLTLALADDPANDSALSELVRIRHSRADLVDLEQMLATLAERLVQEGDAPRAWDVCQRLSALRRDDLGDAAGALEALAIAKRLPLSEHDSRAVFAEQLLALGDDEGAVLELEAMVAEAPLDARAHARLFSMHRRGNDLDRAYLAALALEELGAADATAREILEAYRADWGLRARVSLDDAAWVTLRAPGSDDAIEAVLRACTRAAVAGQFEDSRSRPKLDPSRKQAETSTASIVRGFQWAARALGVPCPNLYVLDDVAGGIAAISSPEPTTAFGPAVLKGLSSKAVAFLAGRQLTYFRPEYQALVHFPTAEALASLFFAAVELVAPGAPVPPKLVTSVAKAKSRLARHITPEELAELSLAVGRLEVREGKTNLSAWMRSVALTAARAGLLLSGDLQTSLALVRDEAETFRGLDFAARRADLLAFCASRELANLRAGYGDTTPASMRPPTTESAVVRRDDPSLAESGAVASLRERRWA